MQYFTITSLFSCRHATISINCVCSSKRWLI